MVAEGPRAGPADYRRARGGRTIAPAARRTRPAGAVLHCAAPPGEEGNVTEMLLVFSAFATEEDAARAVRALVAERLAACGTLLPGARSPYRWRGAADA